MKPYRQKRYRQPKYRPGKDDVDTRSDSTRQGHHEGYIPYGASLGPAGQGPLWLLENVGAGMNNPYLITGHAPATSISANTLNLQRAAAPYLNKVSGKPNALTREYRAKFGDLFDTSKVSDRQLNAVMYGRGLAASAERGKYGAYNSATNRLNVMDNGHIKTMSSIDYDNGHYITEYMEGAPGTHGNVKDQLSALHDLGVQRRSPVYTGENWVATIPHQHAAEALGYKKVGDYGRHENYTLVGDNAKKAIVHTPEQAEKAHKMGYHFIHENAPVYQVTKNASNITTKDINLVDPRAIDSNGKIPFDLNVHDMYRAMLPFAIGGGLWATKDKHNRGKDVPGYRGGRTPVTTGGAGVTSVYQQQPTSEDAQPTIDILERAANFMPYVGTIQDWQQVVQGNLQKLPSTVIGTVADIFLPGLRSSYKAAKAYQAAYKAAPKIADKIKYYKASQKAYRNTATNAGYQAIGTWEDIIDDQQWAKPLYIK